MTSISTHVALAAMALSIFFPAIAIQDNETAHSNQAIVLPSLSNPDAIARQLGGNGEATHQKAVPVNLSQPMKIAPSNRHSAIVFLAATGAGALLGALIDGDDGAGKGLLIGAAVGAGYLIAVHF